MASRTPLTSQLDFVILLDFVFFSGSLAVVHRGRQQKMGGRKSLDLSKSTVFQKVRDHSYMTSDFWVGR